MRGASRPVGPGAGIAATALVALVVLAICLASPNRSLSDSRFTLVLSQSLLETGRLGVDGYFVPPPGRWARFTVVNGEVRYVYPAANAVLSTPVVVLGRILGLPPVVAGRRYDAEAETLLQGLLAALLVASHAAVVFSMARWLLPVGWSLLVVAGAVLGTPVWSTASVVLWTHTWSVVLLGWVVWILLRTEAGRGPLHPVWLATLLAWAFFVRPSNWLFVALVTGYILLWRRASAGVYLATGLIWAALNAGFSWLTTGSWLPPYPVVAWTVTDLPGRLAGVLVSPSRGLLVFVPSLVFVGYALIRAWPSVPHRRLAGLALVIAAAYVVTIATWRWWYGGYSYGPRLLTDLVPWLTVLGILALRGLRDDRGRGPARARLEGLVAVVLLAASVGIQARGAWSPATSRWNAVPVSVDLRPGRVWDWRTPQFLAGLQPLSCDSPR